jgi:hypothetical protein
LRRDVSIYVCFTVPCSFSPIVFLYLLSANAGRYLTIPELVTNGGVLTIAISLAVDALSQLIAKGKKWLAARAVVGASAVLAAECIADAIVCRFLPEDE